MRWIYHLLFILVASLEAAPEVVYLCLIGDPTTTMAVQWVGDGQYLQSNGKDILPEEITISGSGKVLKRVVLRELEPNHEYTISIDQENYRFKTLPKSLGTVRFVIGGDAYQDLRKFRKMNSMVAKLSPDFVVLGGDIAYALGYKPIYKKVGNEWQRWETFFQCWHEQMRDSEGRLIPMVVTTGNHDTRGRYLDLVSKQSEPSLFYTYFPFRKSFVPYQKIVIANSLALILLDSGHTHDISGDQTDWLRKTLKESKSLPYKLAVYHILAYPSFRSFDERSSFLIRKHWSPLFQQYGVQAAFENHNHTYKRTKPQDGVIYLGDGSWGVPPRDVKSPRQRSYLEKSAALNAIFFITLEKDLCQIVALDQHGHEIDRVPPLTPSGLIE